MKESDISPNDTFSFIMVLILLLSMKITKT